MEELFPSLWEVGLGLEGGGEGGGGGGVGEAALTFTSPEASSTMRCRAASSGCAWSCMELIFWSTFPERNTSPMLDKTEKMNTRVWLQGKAAKQIECN